MTIPEIERAEAGIEVKAAAVSNLLPPVHRQAFELPLDGVLVMAATKIRSRLLIHVGNPVGGLPHDCASGHAAVMLMSGSQAGQAPGFDL